jgi:hypothetical protein
VNETSVGPEAATWKETAVGDRLGQVGTELGGSWDSGLVDAWGCCAHITHMLGLLYSMSCPLAHLHILLMHTHTPTHYWVLSACRLSFRTCIIRHKKTYDGLGVIRRRAMVRLQPRRTDRWLPVNNRDKPALPAACWPRQSRRLLGDARTYHAHARLRARRSLTAG